MKRYLFYCGQSDRITKNTVIDQQQPILIINNFNGGNKNLKLLQILIKQY